MNGVEYSANSSINETINISKQSVSVSANNEYENLCEIGSIPFPNSAEWIINAVASFQQVYGELHPYFAIALCISGFLYFLKCLKKINFYIHVYIFSSFSIFGYKFLSTDFWIQKNFFKSLSAKFLSVQ